jgi:DNA-binding Xre family transcriptional regulator
MTRQRRKVSYEWRLRELMAEHKMFATTELVPLLAERGITLSASQVHRLVTSVPERLSMPILAALCDIFEASPSDLIRTEAVSLGVRKVAAGDRPSRTPRSSEIKALRPVRARITRPGE